MHILSASDTRSYFLSTAKTELRLLNIQPPVVSNSIRTLQVLSVGDARSYFLGTAKNELTLPVPDSTHACTAPQVLSLGDARSYFLSTAKNELGVVHATSISGCAMVPVGWEQMQVTSAFCSH